MSERTAFLYPFIDADEHNEDVVLEALVSSAREKSQLSRLLCRRVLEDNRSELIRAGRAMAARFTEGGRLLTFGNGGSATDAQSMATRFLRPQYGDPLPSYDLSSDRAILTAIANDVGYDLVFARQIIALGRSRDIALGISTSGGSDNVIAALRQSSQQGLLTIGLAGYGGGPLAADPAVEFCLTVDSQSVHRTQEAQEALLRALWAEVQISLGGFRDS